MHLKTRNVNTAFRELVQFFYDGQRDMKDRFFLGLNPIVRKPSRVGEVLMIEAPVTITYTHPKEKVLFNRARDANPFFHLYESLWMLAGRQDIAPLSYYSANYAAQVQDGDSPFANGAYGYRWRVSPPDYTDQLEVIVKHLKTHPNSRRAVLTMWNVEDDLLRVDTSKDVCCNLSAMFSLREVEEKFSDKETGPTLAYYNVLDMTVTNRSNDLIWGALGANVVHFAFLQEYVAACLGVLPGVYNQFTNNLHVYTERFRPEEWLKEDDLSYGAYHCPTLVPLVVDPIRFDREVKEFVERHSRDGMVGEYNEPFLWNVAQPMCVAFHYYKRKEYANALRVCAKIMSDDWRIAATNWIERRVK